MKHCERSGEPPNPGHRSHAGQRCYLVLLDNLISSVAASVHSPLADTCIRAGQRYQNLRALREVFGPRLHCGGGKDG